MIGLFVTLIIGIGIAYFSRQTTSGVTVAIGGNLYSNIPLFVITVGTYILGILISWIIEVPQTIATAFRIKGLGQNVKSGNRTIVQLQNKISKLEMENTKYRERNSQSIVVNKQADGSYKPNIIQNFLHRLNLK
jgi:hypothetical protein